MLYKREKALAEKSVGAFFTNYNNYNNYSEKCARTAKVIIKFKSQTSKFKLQTSMIILLFLHSSIAVQEVCCRQVLSLV